MWGFIGRGLLWAGGAFGVYTYRDEIKETFVEEKAEIQAKGLTQYATDLASSSGEFAESAKENIDSAATTLHDVTLDPAGFAERKIGDAFDRVVNPDGDPDDPANHNESGSIFSAVGKLLKGDFSGAASAFSGDDGFGWGDGAKLGIIGAIFYGIFNFFKGDKDENNEDKGSSLINGTTLTIGLAALAFFNRGFIMEKVNDFTAGDQDNTFDSPELEMG